jgi:hypothetical protein
MTSRTDRMSASNSHVAYMREYRKRKRLEGDNCNYVPKQTKLNAEWQCDYRKGKAQESKTSQAGDGHAAYMREYRKRMRVKKYICNNVPKQTKLNAKWQRDYRKHKAQENKTSQASTSTDPTPTPIIYNYDQANEYFEKNFIGNPVGYACDICDRLYGRINK